MASSVVCQGCGREFGIIQQAHVSRCEELHQFGITTRAQYRERFGQTMSPDALAISVNRISGVNAALTDEERSEKAKIAYLCAIDKHGKHELSSIGGKKGSKIRWSDPAKHAQQSVWTSNMNARGSMAQKPNKLELKFWDMIGRDRIEFASFVFWKTIVEARGVKHITPDFRVPGTMRMIEVYGDYWHCNDNPKDRVNLWESVGCECIVVWEHEINAHDSVMLEKVEAFISGIPQECPAPTADQVGW